MPLAKGEALIKLTLSNENMAIETPEYKLISKQEGFEIRRYSDMVVATTKVQADYKNSTTSGFRRIASYIFGGNDKQMKIAMTAPVISDCPSAGLKFYNISFVMPKEHSMEDLPKANTFRRKALIKWLFYHLEAGQLRLEALTIKKSY